MLTPSDTIGTCEPLLVDHIFHTIHMHVMHIHACVMHRNYLIHSEKDAITPKIRICTIFSNLSMFIPHNAVSCFNRSGKQVWRGGCVSTKKIRSRKGSCKIKVDAACY